MPKGPNGEKRPADAIGLAVLIGRIATGEVKDVTPDDGDYKASQAAGKKGGLRRSVVTPAAKRKEIAQKAANARWGALPATGSKEST